MSDQVQERRIDATRNLSALPPRADVGADIVEPPVRARTGCKQSQQTAWDAVDTVLAVNAFF